MQPARSASISSKLFDDEPHNVRIINENGEPVANAYVVPAPITFFRGADNKANADGWLTIHRLDPPYGYRISALGFEDVWIDFPEKDKGEIILTAVKKEDSIEGR